MRRTQAAWGTGWIRFFTTETQGTLSYFPAFYLVFFGR